MGASGGERSEKQKLVRKVESWATSIRLYGLLSEPVRVNS